MNDLSIFTLVSGDVPAAPVSGVNFTLTFSEASQAMTLSIVSPPASAQPITHYRLRFAGLSGSFLLPVSSLPYVFDFTPLEFAQIWQPLVATWNVSATLAAISDAGESLPSASVAVAIEQDDTWFIPASKFTYEEVRTGTVNGATKVTVGDVTIPAGWTLRYYSGPLAYATQSTAIQDKTSALPIDANSAETSAVAQVTGATARGVLVWEFETPSRTIWLQAAAEKTLVVQGLPTSLGFTVTPKINPVSGLYPIGSALGLTFTAVGNTVAPTYQWRIAGAAIPGATGATYTPVAADDVRSLECDVTITNGSTPVTVRTPAVSVTYAKPTLGTAIANVSVTQQSGVSGSVSLDTAFVGSGLTYKVSGLSSLVVNQSGPSIGYDRSTVLSTKTITATAENSGGSVSRTFTLTITANGSAVPPAVQETVGGSSGGNVNVAFTAYAANDMILAFVFHNSSATPIAAPTLAGFTGQYAWNAVPLTAAQLTSVAGAVFYRRANSAGADGLLGPWPTGAAYRYVVVRDVDWADPIGAAIAATAAGAANVDHPGLTLETPNSVALSFAAFATGVTGMVPGVRPGATLLTQNAGSGVRHTLARSVSPVALWSAAADVANDGSTSVSGRSYVAALEVRGLATAAGILWPANVPQNHISVSEVTDPAENTAAGFTSGGHIKLVTSASLAVTATTASGSFTLVRHVLGDAGSTPDNTNPALTAGSTAYTSSVLAVGDTCYPEAWWKFGSGDTAQYKKAWSAASFEIEGLDQPTVTVWPAAQQVGTGAQEARSYPVTDWNTGVNGQNNGSSPGPHLAYAAYAAFAGNSACDAHVIKHIKEGRDNQGGPSLQMGFVGQHDLPYIAAVMWASKTPRIWSQFSSAWKSSLDLFMHASSVAAAGCARETGITSFQGSMLGRTNPSSNPGHNIGTPPAAIVAACAAYFGGVANLKAYLDSVIVADLAEELADSDWTNAAYSFSTPRVLTGGDPAPTLAQLQARIRNWTRWGFTIAQQDKIWEKEMVAAYSKTCVASVSGNSDGITANTIATKAAGRYGLYEAAITDANRGTVRGGASWAYGRGRADDYAGLIADPDYIAIAGKVGAVQECFMMDAGGHRLSGSYAMWAIRVHQIYTLIAFTMGFVDPKSKLATDLKERIRVGNEYMRLTTKYGWRGVAHIVNLGLPQTPEKTNVWKAGGSTWGPGNAAEWGHKFNFDMPRVIDAIYALP